MKKTYCDASPAEAALVWVWEELQGVARPPLHQPGRTTAAVHSRTAWLAVTSSAPSPGWCSSLMLG